MKASVNESYPLNLLDKIADGQWEYPLPIDIVQSLAYVLAGLSEREQFVITSYFFEEKSYEEIAQSQNVTRERIRQLLEKSIIKLRHPTRKNFLIYGVRGEIYRASVAVTQNALSSRIEHALSDIGKIAEHLDAATGNAEYVAISEDCKECSAATLLEDLNLSVRSFNCLKRQGFKTAKDITELTRHEFLHLRSFGIKSYGEVMAAIHSLGLKMADEE